MRATLVIQEMPQGGTLISSPLPSSMTHQWSLLLEGFLGNKHRIASYEWYLLLSVQNVWYIIVSLIANTWWYVSNTFENNLSLTHWGRDKIDDPLQMAFSNAFPWMKFVVFWLKFHWNYFPWVQLTTFQYELRAIFLLQCVHNQH